MTQSTARRNRDTLRKLAVIAVLMFGFGYALVPLYKKICEVTGVNDLVKPDAIVNTQVDTSRTIIMEFDAMLGAISDGNSHRANASAPFIPVSWFTLSSTLKIPVMFPLKPRRFRAMDRSGPASMSRSLNVSVSRSRKSRPVKTASFPWCL